MLLMDVFVEIPFQLRAADLTKQHRSARESYPARNAVLI
jgi:hypothetical protein